MREGKGKGPNGGTPTTPREPGDDQDGGHGHALQFEGFTSDITGTCPDLTIVINEQTIITNKDTDFQRGECTDLKPVAITTPTTGTTPTVGTKSETTPTATAPEEETGFHLHIAAKMDAVSGKLVATYVRMQGPKIGGGEDDEDDDTTTETTK